jgi:hypothetical protein
LPAITIPLFTAPHYYPPLYSATILRSAALRHKSFNKDCTHTLSPLPSAALRHKSFNKDPTFDGLTTDLVNGFANCRFDETQSLTMLHKLLLVRPQRIISCMAPPGEEERIRRQHLCLFRDLLMMQVRGAVNRLCYE